jgi:ParB family chromosome partitioning protein
VGIEEAEKKKMTIKKRGLGRGLDALLGAAAAPESAESTESTESAESAESTQPTPEAVSSGSDLRDIPLDLIVRGKYQPRRDMDEEALQDLANSINVQGVMQPIVVRPVEADKFEIIAGERRWRASQLVGLDSIPAMVREVTDEAAIAMGLIENIQRENLNPIEEAVALQRLQQEFELTQQEVADAVGKSRSTVTNLLRLMSLRDDVKTLLEHGDLEMGHARALLALPAEDQSSAARTVVGKGLSVRQTEALVRKLLTGKDQQPSSVKNLDPNIKQLQDDLSQRLGAKVQIQHSDKGKGKLVFSYNSLDELDGILTHIK